MSKAVGNGSDTDNIPAVHVIMKRLCAHWLSCALSKLSQPEAMSLSGFERIDVSPASSGPGGTNRLL